MGPYLGDFKEGTKIYFCWGTNSGTGASITRATNGTIKVYKDDNPTERTAGITDTEDFDGLTGVHNCRIDLSTGVFYAAGHDYSVVLVGATIDDQSVNAVLVTFSIKNRFTSDSLFEKAAKLLVNKAVQDKLTGVIDYYDDDGQSVILTHTPQDDESTITRMAD